jgi:hypothetical protein
MRRILAVLSAGLLAITVTATPAPAADLGMPLKAPPITAAPAEVDYWPIFFAALIATGVGLCIALCEEHHGQAPTPASPGATGHSPTS